jgi:predicted Zn finger-like uncharacterized protein
MYIACPKCDTNFMVLPEQIGNFGRKVKCSKCAHIWHQKLTSQLKMEPLVMNFDNSYTPPVIGNGVNLPALLPIKIPEYLYFLPFILIGLIITLSVILFPNIYGIDSALNHPKLNIKDIHVESQKELGKVIISYKVMNSSPKNIQMPLVRIRLIDKNSRPVKSYVEDKTSVTLLPNQYVNIKTEFVAVPASTKNIDITLGNRLDFILR